MGFIILTLIITAGAVAMSYSSIQTEVSKVIMTPEEITIINSMNKVSKHGMWRCLMCHIGYNDVTNEVYKSSKEGFRK